MIDGANCMLKKIKSKDSKLVFPYLRSRDNLNKLVVTYQGLK